MLGQEFTVLGIDFSPIKGPEGNIEFLIVITKNEADDLVDEAAIDLVVGQAKEKLGE